MAVFIGLFLLTSAGAVTLEGAPHNYRRLLNNLNAGDTLELQPGVYSAGLPIHRMVGEEGNPIVITGVAGQPRPLFVARSGHNTVSIVDSAYVHLKNLELDGRGLPIDGVKAEGHSHWAHHIVLENLLIRGHGNNQQKVGISTKCLAWGWTIRNNVILGAGTGIYLGDSDGRRPFVAGLIEHNLIVDSIGYNLQIKHQLAQPELPGLPSSSKRTIIRHNVFIKSKAATEEGMARPNVLVGHWPLSGPGVDDLYEIYGNLFYDNPSEALFQGEGNIGLYNNLFVNPHGDAIHIQPHNDVPKQVDIFRNTVVAAGDGIIIRHREDDFRFSPNVVANAVFASPALTGGRQQANVFDEYDAAGRYLTRPYGAVSGLDLYPRRGQLSDKPIDLSRFDHHLEWDRDFDGVKRMGRFVGGYSGEGINPGWRLRIERKP
jgi:hypothetical protein